jgi:hypothetical protein
MQISESLSYRISTKSAEDLWGTWKSLYIPLCKMGFIMNIRGSKSEMLNNF